jgi:DNA-binding IclR family transcriptional regulator
MSAFKRRVDDTGDTPKAGATATKGDTRGVQSIEVGARLLAVLAGEDEQMMLRDLARKAGLAPAQAHAYLVSFRRQGLVEQDGAGGRYRLGPFALQLGIARMRSIDPFRIASNAIVGLAQETGLVVAIVAWGAYGPTVIHIEEGGVDQVYINTRPGTVYSVTNTASGRIFAAYLPKTLIRNQIKAQLEEGEPARFVGKVVPFEEIEPELRRIRELGYAAPPSQPVLGIRAISAPVLNHVGELQMAVTLIGSEDVVAKSMSELIARLRSFAASLSWQLGYDDRQALSYRFGA